MTVLIIGGGIAGPVTAMALRKANIDAAVYEAYPTGADDVGAFLTIMGNGLDALRAVNLYEAVEAASFPAGRLEFLSGTGKNLGEVRIDQDGKEGPRTLKRATLYRVLHDEAARRGIRIEHGKRLVSATTNGGVIASFDDGTTAGGTVLVGADGARSVTRTLIDPAAPKPRHNGKITLCGYTRDAESIAPPGTYRMVYGRRAFFGYTTDPGGQTWWFTNLPGAELTQDETTTEQWKERARGLFDRDRTPVRRIVETSDHIVASNAYDIPSTPTWHTDRMVIIGDAAHVAAPNAGQGASMAIEDAVVLGKCLRDVPEPRAAFQVYEGIRRERVERVVDTSARMGSTAVPGPFRRMVRDLVLPRLLKKGPRNTSDWLTLHHIDWDQPVTR